MKLIRHGYTRDVILIGGLAFKTPSLRNGTRGFVMGMFANIQERDFWKQSDKMACLAPVYFHFPFGLLNVAKRFKNCDPPLPDGLAKQLPFIGNIDLKSDNFGLNESGELVLLDYGNLDLYFDPPE